MSVGLWGPGQLQEKGSTLSKLLGTDQLTRLRALYLNSFFQADFLAKILSHERGRYYSAVSYVPGIYVLITFVSDIPGIHL